MYIVAKEGEVIVNGHGFILYSLFHFSSKEDDRKLTVLVMCDFLNSLFALKEFCFKASISKKVLINVKKLKSYQASFPTTML